MSMDDIDIEKLEHLSAVQREHLSAVQREIEANRRIYGSVAKATRDVKRDLPSQSLRARRGQA